MKMSLDEAIKHLAGVADGYENAAYIEEGVQRLLEPDYRDFHEGDRTDRTLRRVRAGNESRDAHARYVRDAKAIRALIAAVLAHRQ